jgi:hypothetical protein
VINEITKAFALPPHSPTPRFIEPRWPVVVAVIPVLTLVVGLPDRVRVFPTWVPIVLCIILIVPMSALALTTAKVRWLRIESVVVRLFFVTVGFGLVDQLVQVLSTMVRRSAEVSGLQLLTSSIAGWATNVLIFAIAYWRTDRGGPEARSNHASTRPDWLFPQQSAPEDAPLRWRPTFIDYLFLSYCTATAFSPAEAQPLTSRAMLLLMLESIISLITIVAIASRAISILGGKRTTAHLETKKDLRSYQLRELTGCKPCLEEKFNLSPS